MPKIDPGDVKLPRPAVPRSLYVGLIHQSSLPPSTRLVLLVIAWSAHKDGTGCWLSLTAIATRTGLTKRYARKVVASSISLGWLVSSPRPGRTNDWILAAPATVHRGVPQDRGGGPPGPGGEVPQDRGRKNLGRTKEVRARVARRAWCGVCAEDTRLREDPDGGTVRRCQECHPMRKPLRGPAKPPQSAL